MNRRSRSILISWVFLIGLPLCSRAAPRIECDSYELDFGTKSSNETAHAQFELRNAGDSPLEIEKVKTSCGCTVADLPRRRVPAGDSVTVKVRFSLVGRSGQQRTTVRVHSNDPNRPVARFVVRGTVEQAPNWTPATLNFGRIGPDEKVSRAAVLSGLYDQPKVKRVTVDSPAFSASWEKHPPTGRCVVVKTQPPLAPGGHHATVELITDHPDYPRLSLTVFAFVPPPLRVVPGVLLLSPEKPRRETAVVVLLGRVDEFRVKRIRHPSVVSVEASQQAPNRWKVEVSGLANAEQLDGQSLEIETDVPGMKTVTVPIRMPAKGLVDDKR